MSSGGKSKKPKRVPLVPARATTGFGNAVANPMTGQYSYTLDPRLAAMRDQFYGGAQGFLPSDADLQFGSDLQGFGRDLMGLGGQQLWDAANVNPQDASTNYFNRIQELQAPIREQEEARLANSLFKTGRSGAASSFGGQGYINPQQFALLTARERADQQLGLDSEMFGRNLRNMDIASALGLQGAGFGNIQGGEQLRQMPYQSAAGIFGLGTGIEQLGMMPLQIGMQGAQMQLMAQQQQQAVENARASAGKGGGLLGGLANAGLSFAMSGGNPFATAGGLFSGMSGGMGGIGNVLQYGGNVSPFAGAYSINQNPYLNWS